MRKASPDDIQQLVAMMTEFYAESAYTLNQRRATDAFTALLADERLGHVWFIQSESESVGYIGRVAQILTLKRKGIDFDR